jgi:hypothetical protein
MQRDLLSLSEVARALNLNWRQLKRARDAGILEPDVEASSFSYFLPGRLPELRERVAALLKPKQRKTTPNAEKK